jgi:hypothetical protein
MVKIVMTTNNLYLYQLANNEGGLEIAVKIEIFPTNYQRLHL